jgi:hypothetical protein
MLVTPFQRRETSCYRDQHLVARFCTALRLFAQLHASREHFHYFFMQSYDRAGRFVGRCSVAGVLRDLANFINIGHISISNTIMRHFAAFRGIPQADTDEAKTLVHIRFCLATTCASVLPSVFAWRQVGYFEQKHSSFRRESILTNHIEHTQLCVR